MDDRAADLAAHGIAYSMAGPFCGGLGTQDGEPQASARWEGGPEGDGTDDAAMRWGWDQMGTNAGQGTLDDGEGGEMNGWTMNDGRWTRDEGRRGGGGGCEGGGLCSAGWGAVAV